MKFGKYLQATLTPEWKKAYIDYRALKKCIKSIREAQEGLQATFDSPIGSKCHFPLPGYDDDESIKAVDEKQSVVVCSPHPTATHFVNTRISYCSCSTVSSSMQEMVEDDNMKSQDDDDLPAPPGISTPIPSSPVPTVDPKSSPDVKTVQRTLTIPTPALFLNRRGRGFHSAPSSTVSFASIRRLDDINPSRLSQNPMTSLPLKELLPLLSTWERSFFDLLDKELKKVELFYLEQEKIMRERGIKIEQQLRHLSNHKPFYQLDRRLDIFAFASSFVIDKLPVNRSPAKIDITNLQSANSLGLNIRGNQSIPDLPYITSDCDGRASKSPSSRPTGLSSPDSKPQTQTIRVGSYQHARKILKKAVLEHYRGLEMLDNYQALNTVGFQKALKKFEKVTKIPSLNAYMQEKVAPCAFSSGDAVGDMMRDMERLFASLFQEGDKKKPTDYLRGNPRNSPHHFSTFRTGLMLGIALPALLSGVYYALQKQVEGWDSLLYVYAILSLPPIFALLVGLNIQAWSRHRINYQFVFDLDIRTQLDHRKYFEAPAFLFSSLVYAFWLSFSGVLRAKIDAKWWPIIWLGLVACTLFNPLPLLFKSTRWWLLRKTAKVFAAGFHVVEFSEFWLADQLCSMSFTLSNFYFVACSYAGGTLGDAFQRCGSSASRHKGIWVGVFFLASAPTIARLVQSLRRWHDSRNRLHLINAGKYATSILTFLFWFRWRSFGYLHNSYFRTWIACAFISAVYAGLWDIYMDWSFFKLKCKYRLLREELVYAKFIPFYYFAIITNTAVKFTWLVFVFEHGPRMEVRSFIVAFLEIFRRFQWNFFRVENEHIGNVDQYQATKEFKLPYTIDEI